MDTERGLPTPRRHPDPGGHAPLASTTGAAVARPRIGVTGSADRFSPSWLAISTALRLAGARPLRITVRQRVPPEEIDAVVVSGGDDIHPGLYGSPELPHREYDLARDELEQLYIHDALKRNIPLLGICRGHQLLNVVMGGSLLPDIRRLRRRTSNFGTILPRKTVLLSPDSLLCRITGRERLRVNSLHCQAVDRVAGELRVGGTDLDSFVQVLEASGGAPLLGVQWHPEYLFYRPDQLQLFSWLVREARRRHEQRSSAQRC